MSLATHRTRGVGEIIDATFALYRAHFATILTIAMLIVAFPTILKALVPVDFQRIFDFVGNLIIPIAQGAITAIVTAAVERGETLDVGEALRSTTGRRDSLIAVQIATGFLVVVGLALLIVPGLIALTLTAVAVPVIMVEQLGYSKAIERSRALARGRWKHVLGTVLLAWGIAALIIIGGAFVAGLFGANGRIADLVVGILFAVIFPIPAIAMAFLYYDLRVRAESADLDAMITALPNPTPPSQG